MFRGLLADDLSGAADSSTALGRPVRITFWPAPPWDADLDPRVIQVHDTESRSLQPRQAAERVASACGRLPWPSLYKKVDSTLRGNPGAEIAAVLQSTGYRMAVVAPALPGQGRTVAGGILKVHGEPVTQTAFGTDPRAPVRHDRVADLLRATTPLQVVEMAVADLMNCSAPIAVIDATTAEDLHAIAACLTEEMLPVGSAGLARAISALRAAVTTPVPVPRCQAVVILVGSGHPAAAAQAAKIGNSDRVILRMGSSLEALTADLGGLIGHGLTAVVATGGETALAACRVLGATALWPQGELAPGVPWSLPEGVEGVLLVSKAGGFGSATVLRDVVKRLLGNETDG